MNASRRAKSHHAPHVRAALASWPAPRRSGQPCGPARRQRRHAMVWRAMAGELKRPQTIRKTRYPERTGGRDDIHDGRRGRRKACAHAPHLLVIAAVPAPSSGLDAQGPPLRRAADFARVRPGLGGAGQLYAGAALYLCRAFPRWPALGPEGDG